MPLKVDKAYRDWDSRLRRTFYCKKLKFGAEAYGKLLEHQGGVCAICRKPPLSTRLAVDHCHTTGLLRGLLCFRCNRGYGLWHDGDIARLLNAADYLVHPPACSLWGQKLTAVGRIGTKKRAKLIKKMMEEDVKGH